MALDPASADHACNVVRRQIQDEFPDLTLAYLVYQDGQREKTLEARHLELRQHPAAEAVLPYLKNLAGREGPEFAGISIRRGKKFYAPKFLKSLAREKIIACFFVDSGKLSSPDEARRHALALAWHALSLLEDYKGEKKNQFQEKAGIIIPRHDKKLRAWKNMLADAFSVLVLEMEKRRDSIGTLGRWRSQMALGATPGAVPEQYPFPLVFEATRLLYNELGKTPGTGGLVKRAQEMTREIGETFDRDTVPQWWAFCKPAQEMAWLGAEPNVILGAAVYNSEDPYARATAYLVAEALNIQTLLPAPSGTYNPFAESETNERYHLKACEEGFRHAVAQSNQKNNSLGFVAQAEKQNQRLLAGQPLGWCAYALLCTEVAYRTTPDKAREVFDKALSETPWAKIDDMVQLVLLLRREGEDVTPALLARRLEEVEDLKFLAPCFLRDI